MPFIESLDYLNLNTLRNYPIREALSKVDTTGAFAIPDDFIADFTISATSDVTARFYISRILNKLTSALIEVSDSAGTAAGTFTVDFASHTLYKDYYMVTAGSYAGANGKITIAYLDSLKRQPAGSFLFTLQTAEFEPRTVIPTVNGVSRITFVDSNGNSQTLTGDVKVLARSNLRFTFDSGTNTVTVDGGDGLGLSKKCTTTNCVERINGVVPDPADGNISLLGVDCTTISNSAAYTLSISDHCCTPCSGCDDLAELTTRLTTLESKFIDLKGYYSVIGAQLTTYLATVNANCACPA